MRPRYPAIPTLWLMTDERMGDALWVALERLPRGAGVVFRHYSRSDAVRRALLRKIAGIARKRRLILIVAGTGRVRGVAGSHNRRGPGLRTVSAHNRREAIAAASAGADAVFISPVFATRSHPGAKPLGVIRFASMVRGLKIPVIALGGMNAQRAFRLKPLGANGWAGIDAWL